MRGLELQPGRAPHLAGRVPGQVCQASLQSVHNSPCNLRCPCAASDPSPEATLYQVPITPLLAPILSLQSTSIPLLFGAET